MKYRDELLEMAAEMGITIKVTTSTKDQNRIAIHLKSPELFEIEDALFKAEKGMFTEIVIHNELT